MEIYIYIDTLQLLLDLSLFHSLPFIIKHNILINSQYGFRGCHNTQHAILHIVNTIQSNMNSGKFTCGLFIDLKKAYDTVDHYILLQKLDFYHGIRGIVNDWFRSYLTYRKQTTSNGSYISNSETTLYGVPQGSVLGPLLFLLYVNDIANSSKHLSFYLFADDTSIIYANKNLHNLEQIVNSELSNVSDWLLANKLTLNFKKSNYVLFRPRQKCLTYNPSIKAYDPAINALSTLEKKDFVKYLGVLIDYELSWKNHINLICLKISRTVGILAKLRHSIPLRPLLNIYQALINPYLYYGICAWGSAPKTYLNKILLIQKRALRLIYFTDYKQHAVPFFLNSKVFPLYLLFTLIVFVVSGGTLLTILHLKIKQAFTRISEV